jgi:hypothetical protein
MARMAPKDNLVDVCNSGSRKKRDSKAYDRARYLRLKGLKSLVKDGDPIGCRLKQERKRDVRSYQRPDESDEDYNKRIHRYATKLYKRDPDQCLKMYPTWKPRESKAMSLAQRREKSAACMRRLYADRKAAATASNNDGVEGV